VARKVVLLDSASRDLTELGLYIASQSGVQVANGYLDRIYATCIGLAHFRSVDGGVTTFCRAFERSDLSGA
jgi:plasmid stabilization system protein ParE